MRFGKPPPQPPIGWASDAQPWVSDNGTPNGPASIARGALPQQSTQQLVGSLTGQLPGPGMGGLSGGSPVTDNFRFLAINSISVTVGTTSILFLPQPVSKRNFLGFRNASSTQTLYVDFGQAATTTSWLQLTPGALFIMDNSVSQDDLWVVSDAAAATFIYAYSNYSG